MSWWSILVICISRAAHFKSPKSCVLEATLAHPQVPGGSLVFTFAAVSEREYSSPILWRRWSCSRAHSLLCPERVEAVLLCQELPSAVQGMDGVTEVVALPPRCVLLSWGAWAALGNGDKYPAATMVWWPPLWCWFAELAVFQMCSSCWQLLWALVQKSSCCWRVLEK